MTRIEFLYDFGSPNAYLVHKVLPGIAARNGAAVEYQPVLLGGIFKATNNQSPITAFAGVTHKLTYQQREIARFVTRHGISFLFNPHFPIMTISLMRGAVFAQGQAWERDYIDTVFDAIWRDGKNMGDSAVVTQVLQQAGLPVDQIVSAIQRQEVKNRLIETTSQAVERGVFGVPSMFVGDELFFGKDSLDDMERELLRLES